MSTQLTSLAVLLALVAPAVAQSQFAAGDLFLNSHQLVGPSGAFHGVLRIDPLAGVTEVVAQWDSQSSASMGVAYDPFRDRILASGRVGDDRGLYAIDGSGALQLLQDHPYGYSAVAPVGDGRVYLHPANGSADRIFWLDASGVNHELLDVGGQGPFLLPSGDLYSDLIYDPGTDSLLLATRSQGGDYCPVGGGPGKSNFWRLPLTSAGDALRAPVLCTTFDITASVSVEWPRGWSRGPGGAFIVGLNGHTTDERSALIVEPETMTLAEYCGFDGSPKSFEACVYSDVLGAVLILDGGNDVLRAFGPGEFGDGIALGLDGGLNGMNSGFNSRLAEVEPIASNSGLSVGGPTLSLSAGGSRTLFVDVGAPFAGDIYLVAGSVTGWTPGFSIDGLAVPLAFDGYTSFTLAQVNSPLLPASLGFLDGAGRAQTPFTIAAGSDPSLAGKTVWHAALVLSTTTFGFVTATNPAPIDLIP